MTKRRVHTEPRRYWSPAEDALLRELYPHHPTRDVARMLERALTATYARAAALDLRKSAAYLASPASGRLYGQNGKATRFQKGQVPPNKGLRRPGYAPGRMRETQFKKGQFPFNRDPDFYVLGALRVNTEGYIEMRTSFEPGGCGWSLLHRILWEDAHGPVPRTHALVFKDGDRLNVELDNLEVITRAELIRRNTIHNLPAPLKSTITVLGQLKRRIREEQNRGSAEPPVRDA